MSIDEQILRALRGLKGDVEALVNENKQLREERASFQRVGIKVQEVNVQLVAALEKFADESNWMGRNKHDMEWTHGIIEWDGDMNPIRLANEALQAYKLLEKKD